MALTSEVIWRIDTEQYPWNVTTSEASAIALVELASINNPNIPFDIYPVTRYIYTEE